MFPKKLLFMSILQFLNNHSHIPQGLPPEDQYDMIILLKQLINIGTITYAVGLNLRVTSYCMQSYDSLQERIHELTNICTMAKKITLVATPLFGIYAFSAIYYNNFDYYFHSIGSGLALFSGLIHLSNFIPKLDSHIEEAMNQSFSPV